MAVTVRQLGPIIWSSAPIGLTVRQMTPIIWYQDPPQGKIRQAIAHTLSPSPATGFVRQASVHILQPQRKNPTMIGVAAIMQLINSESSYQFTTSNLTLGTPTVDTSIAGTNTSLQLTALPASGYVGSYTVHYNRTSLAAQFASTQWLLGTIAAATTIHALIPQINAAYGVYLDPTDVNDGPVAANATQLQLTVAGSSYVYAPGQSFYLMNTAALATAAPVTALAGFDNATGAGPRNTYLAYNFNGTNGQKTAVDVLGRGSTVVGNAVISTTTQKYGSGSMYIPSGAASSVTVAEDGSIANAFAADFTVEAWVYLPAIYTYSMLCEKSVLNDTTANRTWIDIANNTFEICVFGETTTRVFGTGTPVGQWFHVAFVRKGSVWTCYLNGTAIGTTTTSAAFGQNAGNLIIGNNAGNGISYLSGYMNGFRISKMARYTANFTPPAYALGID